MQKPIMKKRLRRSPLEQDPGKRYGRFTIYGKTAQSTPRRTRADSPNKFRTKKSLGQHFLMHPSIAERIADVANISSDDVVLEIGPGTGMLTKPLLARAKKVIAIETDAELIEKLPARFADEIKNGWLTLIHGDIRDMRDTHLSLTVGNNKHYQVVANIPYYLTGEILRKFLSATHKPSSMTLLVQKEVAERIVARKSARGGSDSGGKESMLSVSVKAYGTPRYRFTVPRGAFVPAPKVDSAVISITDMRADAFASPKEEKRFFDILHAGFAHKRKKLAGNLAVIAGREAAEQALRAAGIPENARPEDVSPPAWRLLAQALSSKAS